MKVSGQLNAPVVLPPLPIMYEGRCLRTTKDLVTYTGHNIVKIL